MPVQVQLIGYDEFLKYLRDLPEHLVAEATAIVTLAAQRGADDVRSNYPTGPGSRKFPPGVLKSRVTVSTETSRGGAFARVSSRAPHAWIFEHGTGNRRTDKGWPRGRMGTPSERGRPEQAMIPHVIRARARMWQDLVAMVERQGFTVAA
jgi:hypothetical protein